MIQIRALKIKNLVKTMKRQVSFLAYSLDSNEYAEPFVTLNFLWNLAQTGRPVCAKFLNCKLTENLIFSDKNQYFGTRKYSVFERKRLAKFVAECKKEYEEGKGKRRWDVKSRKMVRSIPKEGFVSKAVRKYYKNLEKVPSSDNNFKNALYMARRAYNQFENPDSKDDDDSFESGPSAKKRFRREGAGRKCLAPEFRDLLFEWFIGKLSFCNIFISL